VQESITKTQTQFNAAMTRYHENVIYRWSGPFFSFANVSLQITLGILVFRQNIAFFSHSCGCIIAYVLADFVNGWVHLYMDNNAHYEGWSGPFMASFHLHHRTPKYKKRPTVVVYYVESGSKIWLFFVTIAVTLGNAFHLLDTHIVLFTFYFSVFSSLAEVSHYWCHARKPRLARILERLGLILSTRYHAKHHREDNVQYAFLNGMTDPLLNFIAKRYYSGYKTTTDTHYANYRGSDTENRA
jgi:hypothetical protein